MTRRRDAIRCGIAASLAIARFAQAQSAARVWRIGYIGTLPPQTNAMTQGYWDAFTQALAERGYVEGRNLAAAQKFRMPTIAYLRSDSAGVLMTYGPNRALYFPRAVAIADKILKGDRPGDLPIEGPDHFELVINLKIAKALGLTIPQSLLLRADEVIE